jgi:hypothetical protein
MGHLLQSLSPDRTSCTFRMGVVLKSQLACRALSAEFGVPDIAAHRTRFARSSDTKNAGTA